MTLLCEYSSVCSILLSFQTSELWSWQLAANRDEWLARPSAPPMVLSRSPRIVGGKDLEAGGTWFAIQPTAHMFAGLTNRRYGSDPEWRGEVSRGLLITEILKAPTARRALDRLQTLLSETSVNHFMMLIGDADTLHYVDYDSGRLTMDELSPGHYVLSNTPLADGETTKMRWLKHLLIEELSVEPHAFVKRAQTTLAKETLPSRGTPDSPATSLDALNVRSPAYGTCSSAIAVCHVRDGIQYLATRGNPSDYPFEDVSVLLVDIEGRDV
ncbi:MAG: NRDE family protein [Bradymonadia bacterium]